MPEIEWSDSKVSLIRSTDKAKNLMKSKGPLMVLVYADWCGHCQAAAPEIKELAKKVDGKATIYAIESADYKDSDVKSFPTIKIVKDGLASNYDGDRSAEKMSEALLGKGNTLGGKRSRRGRSRRLRNRARKTHRASR